MRLFAVLAGHLPPRQRSASGVHCVISETSFCVSSSPLSSVGTERTKWPGTPSVRCAPWHDMQS